jgi:kynurenine formamidase
MADQHEHDHEHSADGINRREFVGGCGAVVAFAAAGTSVGAVAAQAGGDVEELLSDAPDNWGRWGEDDELGALNLLGSEEAHAGLQAATRRGAQGVERFTLQLSMTGEVINPDPDQPDVIFPDGEEIDWPSTDTGDPAFPPRTPARRDSTTPVEPEPSLGGMKFVDDKWVTDFFLQGTTHVDALGHAWYGEEIYNGFSARTTEETKQYETALLGTQGANAVSGDDDRETLDPVEETRGLGRADVSNPAAAGIAGRGVLLDVGRHMGDVDGRLPMGTEITLDDLMETAEDQGTEIRQRDILLVRTGAMERVRDPNAEWAPLTEPGIVYSDELVEWFHEQEIPYVGADNLAVEKVAQTIDGDTYVIPLHGALLRDLGVYLNEVMDLSGLGAACAEDGIYEFLFTGAPLHVERGSGAPVNPVVLKASGPERGDGRQGDGGGESGGDGAAGDGNQTDANQTDANQTTGNETDGNVTDGNVTGGNETGGNETDGNATGGNATGGNETGGNTTGGNTTGGNNSTGG